MPNPALAGGGVLTATAEPTTTAATATMIRSRIRNCCRHSRLKRRQAQRSMARRAGTPPVVGSGADSVAGRSRTPTLIGSGGRRGTLRGSRPAASGRRLLPSRRKTTRSAHEASWASWVTTTAAMPRWQAARIRRMTASALVESSAPDGSSARSSWRSPDHGAGDGDPLALATRELVGVVRRPVLQPEVLERLERRRLGLAGRDAVELQRQGHVLHRAEPGQQVVVLEDVADGLAAQPRLAVARQRGQRPAADVDLTAGGVLEAAGDGQAACSCPSRWRP